jgi:hypothetical protein
MIRALQRLLCRLGIHDPPPGYSPAWSIFYICERCSRRVDGKLAQKRRVR